MKNQARRDTNAEIALRKVLHAAGFRYRVDVAPLRGVRRRADIVFPTERVAVFVDGCFWHSCPQHGTAPAANAEWWKAKLAANVVRDVDTDEKLVAAGWTVVRVWEHEAPSAAARRVARVVTRRRNAVTR
jgi:DNA mismatch endonuclease, patch repair protein